ncbi:hypothetical protein Tco_1521985, partial [Tanacetum coccineum]
CGDVLVKEKIPSIRRISGWKTLPSFPKGNERKVLISEGPVRKRGSLTNEIVEKSSKGNETKRSISENSSEKGESQSDRRRGKSLSSLIEEAGQSKDQNEMIHIQEEKDQNKKLYCHYTSLCMINIKTKCFVVQKRMIGMRNGTTTTLLFDIKAKCFIIRKRIMKMRKKGVGLSQEKVTIPEGRRRWEERLDHRIRRRSGIARENALPFYMHFRRISSGLYKTKGKARVETQTKRERKS